MDKTQIISLLNALLFSVSVAFDDSAFASGVSLAWTCLHAFSLEATALESRSLLPCPSNLLVVFQLVGVLRIFSCSPQDQKFAFAGVDWFSIGILDICRFTQVYIT